MANYSVLDKKNREAMDLISKDIRGAKQLNGCTNNTSFASLSLINQDDVSILYTFDSLNGKILRTTTGGIPTQTLVEDCKRLEFIFYTRVAGGGFKKYQATNQVLLAADLQNYVKAIQLSWAASSTLKPSTRTTTENIQTALIVLREKPAPGAL